MNEYPFTPSRRTFVRQACCAAVGSTGIVSALAQLRVIGALAATGSTLRAAAGDAADYKALVCLFLNGGNDGNNLIVPFDQTSYNTYASARGNVAVAQTALLPITPKLYRDGRSYALHPAVPGLQSLFTQGKVAVLANVGTLLRPTTLAQYRAGTSLPPQLYSHSDQITQWQSSLADRQFETGWGGRLADMMDAMNSNNRISMAISSNGSNKFQLGNKVIPLSVDRAVPLLTYSTSIGGNNKANYTGLRKLMDSTPANLLEAAFGQTSKTSFDDSVLLSGVLSSAPTLKTVFPDTVLAQRLKMFARLISVAPTLGLKRQIFFCNVGGFDVHTAQNAAHTSLLADVNGALASFYNATVELGLANQVTTFTASDFARTYVPNADGTDHAWGNHQIIMGGAVKGGDFYGTMPSLALGGPDDVGRGVWIPTTSVDEYSATLATWFGVSASNLSTVLPNIGRFAKPNLGFL